MKQFVARQAELPIYPAYEVQQVGKHTRAWPLDVDLLDEAAKDPGFAQEWKDALAGTSALAQDLGSMTHARLAPTSQTRLVEVSRRCSPIGCASPMSRPDRRSRSTGSSTRWRRSRAARTWRG
jgi:hypothetical protein